MLGFGALGELPLADDGFTGAATSVALPAVALSLVAPALGVQTGKNINLPPWPFALAAPALGVQTGKHINLPPPSFALAAPPIFISISANISLPVVPFGLTAPPIFVASGLTINLCNTFDVTYESGALGEEALGDFALGGGGDPFTVTYSVPVRLFLNAPALGVQAGKNVGLPPLPFTLTPKVPEIGARRRKLKSQAVAS